MQQQNRIEAEATHTTAASETPETLGSKLCQGNLNFKQRTEFFKFDV